MLLQLEIQNVALIDKISLELGNGLNVLTGETGAGKSIIIDSIHAILGERVSKDLIRTGAEKASVEAVFNIENQKFSDLFGNMGIDPEDDGTLIISREFSVTGKNTCRINGKMATISLLKEFGERIIDIHGQFDNHSLLRTESHIELLDCFSGTRIQALKQEFGSLMNEHKDIKSKMNRLAGDKNERERKIDLLNYQIEEIRKAKLNSGEEEDLDKQRIRLSNSEKIVGALSKTYTSLFSDSIGGMSATDCIQGAVRELSVIARLDEKYNDISKKLEDLLYQLEDIVEEVRDERDNVEYNPEMLEQIDERLDLIFKLKKKYGNSIEDIIKYCTSIEKELDEIIQSKEIIEALQGQLNRVNEQLYALALKMNQERREAARILEEKIGGELDELEMKRAQFKVKIGLNDSTEKNGERKFTKHGLNDVEFLISPNVGEPLKPLSKIASGGEMSRIMLAIKNILAEVDQIPTLIFDEIDIGVSGRAAQKVGEKLLSISRSHQVVCVTHLAQIACMGDHHYQIEKVSEEESTHTKVNRLKGKAVEEEIARILGGTNITDITLKHAREMLKIAKQFRTA